MKDIKELLVNESRKTYLTSKEVSEFIDHMIDLFTNMKKYEDGCTSDTCRASYISNCSLEESEEECSKEADKKLFRTSFRDYVDSLPDYAVASLNGANYRVIIEFHNTKDNNNYYSYATIEINR